METLSISLALCLCIVPSGFSLISNIDLHPIAFLPVRREVNDHVPFICKAKSSFLIAACQYSCCKALCIVEGSFVAVKILGL